MIVFVVVLLCHMKQAVKAASIHNESTKIATIHSTATSTVWENVGG